jgi:ABC-2 type transport system permease protein
MENQLNPKLQKYLSVFQLSFLQGLKNYKVLIAHSIYLLTCLLIFQNLWKVAAIRANAPAFTPAELLWYIALNEWVLIAIPDMQRNIENDLRTGRLAYLLTRPISYLGSIFAEGLASLLLQLAVLGAATFAFTYASTGSIPFTAANFCLMLALGVLAGILGLIFQMLVGLSGFWLHDVTPFSWVWEKLLFVFGGLFVPLSIYPGLMYAISSCSPFFFILGGRSDMVFGFTFSSLFWLIGVFLFWFFAGILLLKILFQRGLKILNIHGG